MPTSQFMPDVKVEIAFNAGYNTPEASRVWTDVSQWVELNQLIKIERGRSDEIAETDPNKLELVVDNSDGRFTPKRATSPYYPNVKIGRPIRVTATPPGGVVSVRFVGFVEQWPLEWNLGVATAAQSKITALSRMARLGIGNELEAQPLAVARNYGVDGVFPLSEPAGSRTVADVIDSGRTLNVGRAGVTLGGEGGEGLLGATFDGTSLISGYYGLDVGADATVTATFRVTGRPNLLDSVLIGVATSSGWVYAVGVDDITGELTIGWQAPDGSASYGNGPNVVNPETHHLAMRFYTAGPTSYIEAFLDGVNVGGLDLDIRAPLQTSILRIGRYIKGTIADVQVYREYLDDAIIADLSATTLTGNAGETAAQRLERIRATTTAIPASSVSFDPNTGPVERIEFGGRNVLEVMRDVEKAERGVLFDGRDGLLVYTGRAARYNRTNVLILDVGTQEVEAGIAPTFDRQRLVNDVTIMGASGTPWRHTDPASIADYGPAAMTETVALNDMSAQALAQWLVGLSAEPDVRIPALSFDLLPLDGTRKAAALGLDIGSRVTVANLPAQAHATSLPVFVEGITETIGAEFYEFELNVSPAAPYDVFTLNSFQQGVLNSTYRLAL
ncbi:hypothetical protein GCM10008944_01670 [Cytobacillus oceanisediminis]